ncbi:MAG: Transcription termination factor NusA [Candidatus Nomurabacteria bacterium GW2011_GWE1_32_28]|uniref:Transcription termination/antitermination protein NusA n=1 Tax=Candidatus Nomurabacteria bacterium GW2011_GWF1_31_48 TaxID=1618767 RepID=A0A0F9YG47_9BACT|nr:MAG: Transcription termination factor NusA [Candidatus Nomurabacteria bacterium GW2011_GWF2_30_133]KKP28835.1 MAG: Transcription termination factor NusA [Candidatus Nomurabacteria bacterium GW2011_GWE2_31_40]KKP30413.1 MAG: Transcription termination factor NusA [Candidatus Nomurabacteria bacterium GW2011_GWF1_31_48]KKP34940.1 MAG: Transcription termination factor NusA [Candidatus Nomurabacteria bacterium GW2011_GWE1_32_28]HAS81030.1 transcription termination/antitermination protein NusA [Can
MLDIKTFKSALEQLEEEKKIPKEKILDAIEQAMAAAYKKDYGKKGQIIRAKFDLETGQTDFFQIKIVVDETIAKIDEEEEENKEYSVKDESDQRVRFNSEHHIMLEDAKKIKKDVVLNDEVVFPLESKDDYGRIAAQTAKQVIIQRIREAERTSIIDEYGTKEGEIVTGIVQKIERGNVYVDFNRATGILPAEEQIPGEFVQRGQRIRAYLYSVEDTARGINLRLSRTHPKFIEKLFSIEAPEIENGTVEIKSVAREAGARSKIAVYSNDDHIDPVGSCVGQKGTRVNTITQELLGEKIDIIPWSEDPKQFVSNSISPAKVLSIEIDEKDHKAVLEVAEDQLSLAIGKGGQNVRLAAKLTGWRIDIKGNGKELASTDGENVEVKEEEI